MTYVKVNKPFDLIEAPYKCYTGKMLNQSQADFLNRLTKRINADVIEFGEVAENRLNERHRIFTDMAAGRR